MVLMDVLYIYLDGIDFDAYDLLNTLKSLKNDTIVITNKKNGKSIKRIKCNSI